MKRMEPKKQRVWGLPAVANFILGGAGAGLYLLSSLRLLTRAGSGPEGPLAAALVSLGFLALTHEAGRPLRGIYLLSNLRSSWISIELFAGVLFMSAAILDWLFPLTVMRLLAVCGALLFIMSQGFVVYRARAITAWNVPMIPLLFLLSALAMGGGLLLLLSAIGHMPLEKGILTVLLIVLISDMAAWVLYLKRSHNTNFRKATEFLRRPLPGFLVIGVGAVFPLLMLIGLMVAGLSGGSGVQIILSAMTGLAILAGGVSQKIGIMLGAGYLREMLMGLSRDNAAVLKTGTGGVRDGSAAEDDRISSASVRN